MIADALKLSVYFGESVTAGPALASDALVDAFTRAGVQTAALVRGIEGFGLNRRIHAERFPDASTDLPLLAIAVEREERMHDLLDLVDEAVPRGLVTLERARLATGTDVAHARTPPGPGQASKLTVWCGSGERAGRRPAYRAVVGALRQAGAPGAIVLGGVDGLLAGRRRRATLLRQHNAPMIIIAVGPAAALERAARRIPDVLPQPVVTLEPITHLKHDGERLAPLATPPGDGDMWQTIRVYTRRSARVGGHALASELTRRLRAAGAAGATTILGEWGYSSDEQPHGDRLGRVASHRPTYSVYIDRPARVAEVWPVIDELTAEHGIVTSLFVPGYRERAADVVLGRLEV